MMTLENPLCTCGLCCPDMGAAADQRERWMEQLFRNTRPTGEIAESLREGVGAVLKEETDYE